MTSSISRRAFIRRTSAALAVLPVAMSFNVSTSEAQATAPSAPLDENMPTAKALSYTHDASKTTHPAHKAGSVCSNCMLYQKGGMKVEGKPGDWGVCQLFPQGLVAATGWCMSWAPKAAA